eukprot:TRINITY_DN337_c0_g3_i3.p1 TRINITY_DN337_c0_g3~~TRINITY_DN337_c0_g3_i3.p1  ORF type:complete len:216 (-),score=29.48 TRINITY_DN337_c0_g3_i3:238-885(-)
MWIWVVFLLIKMVIHHKIQIFVAGLWINRIFKGTGFYVTYKRMLLHDLSKLSNAELVPYAEHFFGKYKGRGLEDDIDFKNAWIHHYTNNDHHIEYFYDFKTNKASYMPVEAVMELLADWHASETAYNGNWPKTECWPWVERTFKNTVERMHPTSALFLMSFMTILGYERSIMVSLYNDKERKFDWADALAKISGYNKDLGRSFFVLCKQFQKKID